MTNVVNIKMAAAGDEQINPDVPPITFETAWARYPRKVAKKDAMKAWLKVDPVDYPNVMAGIERARLTDDWRKDNGAFIPYFATYLRGERWNDELESDLTMGQCDWNRNGTREPGKPRCSHRASKEKNGTVYCSDHAGRV